MKHYKKIYLLILLSTISLNAMQISDSLRIDSYLNLYTLSSDNEKEEDDENGINTSGGVQARYQVSQNISATGQIYFYEEQDNKANDRFEVDTKWLYMDYYVGYDITLRAGKFQFPIFKSSETGTIGYSYTWTETPLSYYGANGYDDFKGVEILQKYFYDDFEFLLQLSYGHSENELPTKRDNVTVNGETDDLVGITLKTNHDLFNLNVGYLQATSKLQDTTSDKVDLYMFSVEGELYIDDYTLKAGLIDAHLSEIFPDELRYYLSLEYNYEDFTPYIYYSSEILNLKKEFTQTQGQSYMDTAIVDKYSAGIRYDFYENMALKFSYTKEDNIAEYTSGRNDVRTAHKYKAVLNVIF